MRNVFSILFLFPLLVFCGPSKRGKCALECYSRCMQSGTPSAVYCNCPFEKTERTCSSVDGKLRNAEIMGVAPLLSSEYLDAHSIRLQLSPHPAAFSYIFEYSMISTQPDDWYFAGSSVNPIITFTILDSCRDYQFRVIIVLRTTDPEDQFVIYQARPIPVDLPPFSLETSQIFVEPPSLNATTDLMKLYVKWSLPHGYSDADIYGYEAPALYPVQCRTPEQDLPQPRIEIVRGGGRLAVALPSSVLEARCRLWVEVRMLPRCIRLEPFSVQKSIEIDCNKNPEMEVCKKDANPVCTTVIDIYGRKGEARIAWEAPNGLTPIYYHLRYGKAQMQGVSPFVTWQLTSKRNVKVEGGVTSVTLNIPQNEDYGVQICAILTPHRKRPKFGVVRVTPFHCVKCEGKATNQTNCGECAKIEGSKDKDEKWKLSSKLIPRTETDKAEKAKKKSQAASPTVMRMEADLLVGTNKTNAILTSKKNNLESPISLDRALKVHEAASDRQEGPEKKKSHGVSILKVSTTTSTPAVETTKGSELSTSSEANRQIPVTNGENEIITKPSKVHKEENLEKAVGSLRILPIIEGKENNSKEKQEEEKDEGNGPTSEHVQESNASKENIHAGKASSESETEIPLTLELEQSLKTLEDEMKHFEMTSEGILPNTTLEISQKDELKENSDEAVMNKKDEKASDKQMDEKKKVRKEKPAVLTFTAPNIQSNGTKEQESKAHGVKTLKVEDETDKPKWKKCLLKSGIICEFGCETRMTCLCHVKTHVLLSTGACVLKDTISTSCLRKRNINATWDPVTMNILVHSPEASEHIRSTKGADRLFIEFGGVRREEVHLKEQNETVGGFVFEKAPRHKMVMNTIKIMEAGIFLEEPFMFHVNHTIDIVHSTYGMRLCTFNSKNIKDPYKHDWDFDSLANKTGNIVQVVQLSAIHFTNDLKSDLSPDSYWTAFFSVGKITLLVILVLIMFVLVYINCSRIKSLYDRKRTHYFTPYYLDPQIHVTPSSRHSGIPRSDPNSYFNPRSRMI